jgi:exopolysaccharide biosynthesis polyprenyl glycosylphosphotransferase
MLPGFQDLVRHSGVAENRIHAPARLGADHVAIFHAAQMLADAATPLAASLLCAWPAAPWSSLALGLAGASPLQAAVHAGAIGIALAPVLFRGQVHPSVVETVAARPLAMRVLARALCVAALAWAILVIAGRLAPAGPWAVAWVLAWAATMAGLALGSRWLHRHALSRLVSAGVMADRVAVIGPPAACAEIVGRLDALRGLGLDLAGVFPVETAAEAEGAARQAELENAIGRLLALGRQVPLDWILVAGVAPGQKLPDFLTTRLRALDVNIAVPLPPGTRAKDECLLLGAVPVAVVVRRRLAGARYVAKALMDRAVAGILIVACAPLLVGVAIAVRLDSRGPILFRQRRHGRNNAEFNVLKFRTMAWAGANSGNGAQQTRRGDLRVTRVGAFLRASSLDELPQLVNVLRGEMSLVGPRPHPVEMRTENRTGEEIVGFYAHRHRVRPGITGWAQVHGHRGATETAEQLRQRIELDIDYIENWSLGLDLRILLSTPLALVWHRANAY